MKGIKAEFGYDDRIGVGSCDRGPSGLRDTEEERENGGRPVFRAAEKMEDNKTKNRICTGRG